LYIYTSVREENIRDAVSVIEDCINKMKNEKVNFNDNTMTLMKKVLKTAVVFTLEDPMDLGNYVLHQAMRGDSIYRFIYDIEKIEDIGKEDIYEVARAVFREPTIHILKRRS
jgi:predicted Zn-dependent peptidase